MTTKRCPGHWAGALAAALVLSLPAKPGRASNVIVDTFGAGDSYNTSSAWSVGNTTFPPDFATAFLFSGGLSGGYVDQITIAQWHFFGVNGNDHYRASLYLDAPDTTEPIFLPTVLLESVEFRNSSPAPTVITVQTSGSTLLQPLTRYWLAIEPVDGSQAGWMWNNRGLVGFRAHYNLPTAPDAWFVYPNSTVPAFRITATAPVPVPAAIWLLGAGLGALAAARGRQVHSPGRVAA